MINKIHNMDCIEGMKMLPDNSVDLTVTSPPYDDLRKYNGFSWDFEAVARELYRVTKDGGVVVWVVGDKTVNGSETGTAFKQALYFKECGFNLHDTMIFEKNNPVPQADKTRYTQSFEFMFVFSKGKPKTVNRIMTECQHIGKVHFGKNKLNDENCDRRIDRAVKPTKPLKNIWRYNVGINQSSKDAIASKHPAIFPEQLVTDHILSWSNEGDIVLDPFMGSGTTAKMALLNNRNYIGFEISKEYCEIAEARLKIHKESGMKTYTFIVEGKATRTIPISDFEIMQLVAGGGVIAYDHGVIVEFFDKDEAIKAKECVEAKGIKVLSDIVESDNPNYVEVK